MATIEDKTACGFPLPVISVIDRRTTRGRAKRTRFLFVRSAEIIVWNAVSKSNGTFMQLMARHSLESTVLTVDKTSVEDGILTSEEFSAILKAFKISCVSDVEARRRVRQCSLVPVAACVSALTAWGHTEQTSAILKELRSLPRVWRMEEQRLEDEAAGEVDLVRSECKSQTMPTLTRFFFHLQVLKEALEEENEVQFAHPALRKVPTDSQSLHPGVHQDVRGRQGQG